MRKMIIGGLVAGFAIVSVAPAGAAPERDDRPARGNDKVAWDSGNVTANEGSVDGPKSSNSATMNPASYLYPEGYWDMDLEDATWKFSYVADDLTGAGQIRWSVSIGDNDGPWIYLDPYHCPGAENAAGWATADFQREGTDCTIYDSLGNVFTGDDPTGVDGVAGTEDDAAAQTAWEKLEAEHGDENVYISFLIHDGASPDAITVDRVSVAGSTISRF